MKAVKAVVVAVAVALAVGVEALVEAVALVAAVALVVVAPAAAVVPEEKEALAVLAVLVVKEAQVAADQAAVQEVAPAAEETKERGLKCAKMKSTTKTSNMRTCSKQLAALMTLSIDTW